MRGRDDRIEFHIRRGIQIEDQAPGDFRIAGRAIPGMKFQGADLRRGGQALRHDRSARRGLYRRAL